MTQALESKRNERSDPAHYADSSVRENLIEHVFLGELLRGLWRKNVRDLEVLRPEVDSGGYDLALEFRGLTRHMQLKSRFTGARRSEVTASVKLLERPSACEPHPKGRSCSYRFTSTFVRQTRMMIYRQPTQGGGPSKKTRYVGIHLG